MSDAGIDEWLMSVRMVASDCMQNATESGFRKASVRGTKAQREQAIEWERRYFFEQIERLSKTIDGLEAALRPSVVIGPQPRVLGRR